jgi:hypothetical protein
MSNENNKVPESDKVPENEAVDVKDTDDEPIDCDLKEETVKLKVNGVVRIFKIRQMTGRARDSLLTEEAKRYRVEEGRVVGLSNWDGRSASLIARCLYDEKGKMVPMEVIQKWSGLAQDFLYEKCQKLNGLTRESEEEAKKALEETSSPGGE